MTVIVIVLMLSGAFFLMISSIGLLRLPDFYSRTHAAGKSETLGAILILTGLAIHNGLEVSSLKVLIILVFVALTSPTATHAILRAALRCGLEPWTREKKKNGDTGENEG